MEMHFLPGYAPELNPDELVWTYVKRTGTAKCPLARGEFRPMLNEQAIGSLGPCLSGTTDSSVRYR
jgi:hypothetical protein